MNRDEPNQGLEATADWRENMTARRKELGTARKRDSVSGVSIEEEMSNLITYQYAYQASSKIITTADQMLQTVVNLKST